MHRGVMPNIRGVRHRRSCVDPERNSATRSEPGERLRRPEELGCLGFPKAGSDRLRGGAKVVDLDPATEQLMSVASQVLSGGELTALMAIADAKRIVGDDGTIDADALTDQPPSP